MNQNESAARGQGLASHLASPAPSRRARARPRPTRLSPPQDPPLAAALDNIRVAPTFYAFRWISLLMTQARYGEIWEDLGRYGEISLDLAPHDAGDAAPS